MASAIDGVTTAGPPWSLTSASINFAANGVAPNQVVHLTAPKSAFPGGGQFLAIDTVTANTITLRRPHKDIGVGMPPPALTGVSFTIGTLDPQIEEASFDIKRRFGVDENLLGRTSGFMYDARDLRIATVLQVLLDRYTQEQRTATGDFAAKVMRITTQLEAVLGRVQIRWGNFGNSAEPSTVFGMRYER